MYGSVTSADIAHALEAKGFEVDKRKIQLADPIKALGEVEVPVKVHRDVTAQVKRQGRRADELKIVASVFVERVTAAKIGVSSFRRRSPVFFFHHNSPVKPSPWPTSPLAERTLPHSLDAEKSVLGAILIRNEAFNHAAELIDARDFFRDAHRRIFDKMVALSERGDPIDFVTLKEELSRSGELDEVGGPAYIASLADGVPRSRQRRVLRADRQGEVDAPQSDSLRQQHPRRRAYEAEQEPDLSARRGRAVDLRDRRGSDPRRLRAAARSGAEQLRDDREAAAAQGRWSPACRPASSTSTR